LEKIKGSQHLKRRRLIVR